MTKHDIRINNRRIYAVGGPEDDYEITNHNDIDYSDEECVLYID